MLVFFQLIFVHYLLFRRKASLYCNYFVLLLLLSVATISLFGCRLPFFWPLVCTWFSIIQTHVRRNSAQRTYVLLVEFLFGLLFIPLWLKSRTQRTRDDHDGPKACIISSFTNYCRFTSHHFDRGRPYDHHFFNHCGNCRPNGVTELICWSDPVTACPIYSAFYHAVLHHHLYII
jgi:hypothetical protein